MAANVVTPDVSENGVVTEIKGKVQEITRDWSVFEDGALAVKMQEEENTTHYTGNISRRRTVRSDMKSAKSAADEEALKAFEEENAIVEKNRQIEMEDEVAAKKLLHEMMEEEKQKLRERKQQENEERDRLAARELYDQMMEQKQQKAQKQKSFEETDAELALRLQAHEERKRRILSQKQRSVDHEEKSEHLARQLARHERFSSLQEAPRNGAALDEGKYLIPSVADLRVSVDDSTPTPVVPQRGKHKPQRAPRIPQTDYPDIVHEDSDEETDIIAKIQDDEELARRLQREEIQRSRAPSQLTDQQRNQLIHDQKIAIKMQHEEVMFSKKKTYDNYMGKVKDEIAELDPMVYVSRQNKVAVPADAKYSEGVQLTDYTAGEGAQLRRTSGSRPPNAEGNIVASIDPTYQRRDSGNVVLLKKKPITDEQPPEPAAMNVVQGSRRKDSKEPKKRGSIFSKLKKK